MHPLLGALIPLLLTAALRKTVPDTASEAAIHVDAGHTLNRITPWMFGSCIEDVNHEIYGGLYAQQIFGESFEEPPRKPPVDDPGVSGMWDAVHTGSAIARFAWDDNNPYNSARSK